MSVNKAGLLKKSLLKFYTNKTNISLFVDVIEKKTTYSLRVIEWFCNNYSKKNDTSYVIPETGEVFNVYLSYKSQLDSYQKKQFDPFKREHEGFPKFSISFNGKSIYTTVGQLNFFRWCITNKVLDYINSNVKKIKEDMNSTISNNKTDGNKSRKKRQTLSPAVVKTCVKRYTNVVLKFS